MKRKENEKNWKRKNAFTYISRPFYVLCTTADALRIVGVGVCVCAHDPFRHFTVSTVIPATGRTSNCHIDLFRLFALRLLHECSVDGFRIEHVLVPSVSVYFCGDLTSVCKSSPIMTNIYSLCRLCGFSFKHHSNEQCGERSDT